MSEIIVVKNIQTMNMLNNYLLGIEQDLRIRMYTANEGKAGRYEKKHAR